MNEVKVFGRRCFNKKKKHVIVYETSAVNAYPQGAQIRYIICTLEEIKYWCMWCHN